MTENQLRLLLSLEPEDLKWHESWDDDWEALLGLGYIEFFEDTERPVLTKTGRHIILKAVDACNE